ncbi:unnamed protein product, partial [Ixodes hexagonus]
MDTTSMIVRTLVVEQAAEPPDGGWGWVVVLAGFMCHVVVDGIIYSSGVFFDEFLNYFGEGHALTSSIASILMGSYFISSPIASGLTIRYGCRVTAIAGSLLSAAGLFISIYAPNVIYLYFSFGLVTGTGFGLVLLPAVVCVSSYFNRRRALATGMTVCGSGVGTFVLAPLIQLLMRTYGWKGTLIVCSGLSLQGVVAGFLMRPLRRASSRPTTESSSSYEPTELLTTRPRSLAVYEVSRPGTPPDDAQELRLADDGPDSFQAHVRVRKDLFYTGSPKEEHRQPVVSFFTTTESSRLESQGPSHVVTLVDNRNRLSRMLFSYQMAAAFREMLNFRLFGDPVFLDFAVSRFFCGLGYGVPFLFLASRAGDEFGATQAQGSFLVSLIGLTNVIGRVLVGLTSDKVGKRRLWFYMGCVMTCGVSTILSTLCASQSCLQAYACVYGAAGGGFITLSSSYMPGFLFAGVSLYVAGVTLIAVPYLEGR